MQITRTAALCAAAAAAFSCITGIASSQTSLGTAQSFAVLGGSTVTNVGTSLVTGDLGVSPGSAITGFPPGIVTGTTHVSDAVAGQAQADALTTYNALAATAFDTDLTGQDLGGLTLAPGVYRFQSSAQLTGALTLDAMGNDAAEFVFQIGSAITTATSASVTVINGGSACHVFWQVGSSATLGTTSSFAGNVLASASVTLATGTNVSGRVIALNGAVTMDTNAVSIPVECRDVTTFGDGCVGSSATPTLSLTSVIPGFNTTLSIDGGLGGSTAIVFFGPPASHLMPCGCELVVRPNGLVLFLPLAPSGSISVDILVPTPPPLGTFAIQAFIVDPGVPCGVSSTNALQVTIQ